jgi:hypothetical protein
MWIDMSSNSYPGIEPWGPPENFDVMLKYLIDTLPREELLGVYEKIQKIHLGR